MLRLNPLRAPFLLALLLGLGVALAACGGGGEETATPRPGTPGAQVPGQLKIGALLPLTGPLADFGRDFRNAIEMAVEHINAAGGVMGRPVVLVTADDGTVNVQQGVAEARRLVDVERVHVIVGAAASSVTIAVAESVTVPNRILQISPSSTSPAITTLRDNDYLFRTPISDAAQGLVLARLARDEGLSRVATLYVNNAYGQGLSESFARAFQQLGGQVTAQVPHTAETAPSYISELQRAAQGNPEALAAISYVDGQGEVYLREAVEQGLFRRFLFVDGTKSGDMFGRLGWDRFNGMRGTSPGTLSTQFGSQFDQQFQQRWGYAYQTPFVREAYDATVVVALAAEKARSTDSTAIRNVLRDVANSPGRQIGPGVDSIRQALQAIRNGEDIDYVGASGSVEFDQNGDVALGGIEVWRVDAQRRELVTEAVYRVDLRTGEVSRAQ
mgnify:FL=1